MSFLHPPYKATPWVPLGAITKASPRLPLYTCVGCSCGSLVRPIGPRLTDQHPHHSHRSHCIYSRCLRTCSLLLYYSLFPTRFNRTHFLWTDERTNRPKAGLKVKRYFCCCGIFGNSDLQWFQAEFVGGKIKGWV
jgi:hypothetical protein